MKIVSLKGSMISYVSKFHDSPAVLRKKMFNFQGESSGSANENENGPSEEMLEGTEVASYLSNTSFASLKGKVNDRLLANIDKMGFTSMTEIQAKSIAPLLEVERFS